MYHPTTSSSQYSSLSTEHANAITPSPWFVKLYIFKPNDTSLPFKLEFLFLLDSFASICVLNLPNFTILADHFLKCSKNSPHKDEFKTLAVNYKTVVPIFTMSSSPFTLLSMEVPPHMLFLLQLQTSNTTFLELLF